MQGHRIAWVSCRGWRFGLSAWALLTCAIGVISAAEPQDSPADRAPVDADFRLRFETLAAKCDELGLSEQARSTRAWFLPRDPRRQYFFLPPSAATKPPSGSPMRVQQWQTKFGEQRSAYADELFKLAKRMVGEKRGAEAYQLLFEVLRENPDHSAARRVLGFTKVGGEWRMGAKDSKPRSVTVDHPKLGWRRDKYWVVDTAHFHIVTNHNTKSAADLGQRLEDLHTVWRQLFFRYWSTNEALAARLAGDDDRLGPERRHEVVLFRNRQEYVDKLKPVQPQIEDTVGLYQDSQRTAYFFAGDDSVQPTWFHEVTHQLFQEVADVPAGVGMEANIWALEAVAMYLESLIRYDGYATLGGVDADRIQFARYHTLRGEDHPPLEKLMGLGRDELQRDPDIRRIYTHASGLAHFLMDYEGGRYRQAFVSYLTAIYNRRETLALLATLTGKPFAELDAEYHRFLNVTDDELACVTLPPSARHLSLGQTQVTDQGLLAMAGGERLDFIDLSFTKSTDVAVMRFKTATGLKQLFLEKTSISDAALETIRSFQKLEELDLSGTKISDAGLAHLAGLKNLKKLFLTNCPVTDACLMHLKSLKHLDALDTNGTQVTPAGLANLRRALPNLK